MRIFRVSVTYGELRSAGYPNFSNTRHEVSLTATLESGETAGQVARRLEELAKAEVKRRFGDPASTQTEMDLPYERPKPNA